MLLHGLPNTNHIISASYYTELTTSVPEIIGKTSGISIYPNPSTLTLNITSPQPITQTTITNLLEQTVFSYHYDKQEIQIDVSNMTNGIYFVKVNGTEIRKFVKQ